MRIVKGGRGHEVSAHRTAWTKSPVRQLCVQPEPLPAPDFRKIRPDGKNDRNIAAQHILAALPQLSAGKAPQRGHFAAVKPHKQVKPRGKHNAVYSS